MQTDHVQTRVSQLTPLFTKNESCDCPSGPVVWLTLSCPQTIAGRIFDKKTGDPLDEVTVWAGSYETGSYGESKTDVSGRYVIGPIEAGDGYKIAVFRPGYTYHLTEDINVPEYGLTQNLELFRVGAIGGIITNNSGQPIQGVTIYFQEQNELTQGFGEAVTDEKGRFCACDLLVDNDNGSSTYQIIAVHPDYSTISDVRLVTSFYNSDEQLQLSGVMNEKGWIKGNVISNNFPIANARVLIQSNLSGFSVEENSALTDASGSFRIWVSASIQCEIDVLADGYQSLPVTVQVQPGGEEYVEIKMTEPGVVKGLVRDIQGRLVAGAVIEVLSRKGRNSVVESTVTDSGGSYSLDKVPASAGYLICATMPTARTYTQRPAAAVEVVAGQTTFVDLQGDVTIPTGHVDSPQAGSTVSGIVTVSGQGRDDYALDSIGLLIDGIQSENQVVSDVEAGVLVQQTSFDFPWDTVTTFNGLHTLTVIWDDVCGNRYIEEISVTVAN